MNIIADKKRADAYGVQRRKVLPVNYYHRGDRIRKESALLTETRNQLIVKAETIEKAKKSQAYLWRKMKLSEADLNAVEDLLSSSSEGEGDSDGDDNTRAAINILGSGMFSSGIHQIHHHLIQSNPINPFSLL